MKTLGVFACLLLFACGGGNKKPNPTPPGGGSDVAAKPDTPPAPPPKEDKPAPAGEKKLFDRLGGLPAITAVCDEFVNRTTSDPRIKERFFNTDAANLKKLLTQFVCVATGGPCKYEGRDMKTSHAGMDLVDDEFTALVENLVGALDKFKVPEKEKNEILAALGPLKPDIVAPADHLKPIEDAKLAVVTKAAAGVKDKGAQDLLALAVTAGKRGQRSYAEQLFTRAEMINGPKGLETAAAVFRAGAPTRVTTATKQLKDEGAQPAKVGGSETDEPEKKAPPVVGTLHGSVKIDGKAASGLGVVMLFPEKGGKKRTPKTRVIEQRDKTFAPHVMAVPVGSTVSFPNYDPIFHNVFSLSKSKAFDLGMYKNGETREVKLDKAGIVRLGCNLHANMSAYLVVVDAPHYVIVDSDGSYSFKSLAPGKYKVQAWNEQSGEPMVSSVTIKEGANEQDLDLKGGAPAISPDKFGTTRQ